MRRRTWARCIAQKDENCTVTVCRVRPPRPRLPYGPITLYPYPAISTQAQEANSIRRSGRRRARGPPPPSMTQPGVLGNSWTSSHLVTRCLFPAAYGSLGATLRCTQLRSFPTPIFFFLWWVYVRRCTTWSCTFTQPWRLRVEAWLLLSNRMGGRMFMLPSLSFLALSTLLCAPRPDRV
jgi:hypothetical protein